MWRRGWRKEARGTNKSHLMLDKDGAKTLDVIVITIHYVAYVYEAKFLVQAFSLPDWNSHFKILSSRVCSELLVEPEMRPVRTYSGISGLATGCVVPFLPLRITH